MKSYAYIPLCLAACAAILFGASGCSFNFADDGFVANHCASASDCGDGESCDVEHGICVSTATAPLRVGLELVPPNSSNAAGAIFSIAPVSITDATELNITMPAPLLVYGQVRWTNHGEQNVPVQVSIVPGSVIPSHVPASVPASHATGSFHPELSDTTFVANVGIQGDGPHQFDLIIRPTGEWAAQLPPRRIHAVADNVVGGAFEVPALDYPDSLVEITGDVVDANGLPLPGLIVQGVNPITGEVVSSTTTTLDASSGYPGRFVIRLAPEASTYVLRISSGEGSLDPLPTFSVSPDYLIAENDVVRVRVNTTSTFVFQGVVETDFTHESVPGALVQFRMVSDPGTDGTFMSAPVRTGPSGEFSVILVDGTYEIVVTPPTDANDGHNHLGISVVQNVRIAMPAAGVPAIMGQVFTLPERAELDGKVMTSDGRPMVGATIEASALGRLLEVGPETAFNRSNQTITGADGAFALPLDLGVYDLTLKPPMDSDFPWVILTNFAVPPLVESMTDQMLMFSGPIPLQGVVRDESGEPLSNVEVRAFAVIDGLDGGLRSVQIGRAISESDGSYLVLLPPHL